MARKARVVLLCSYLMQFISSASLLPEVLLTFDEQASRPIGKKVRVRILNQEAHQAGAYPGF